MSDIHQRPIDPTKNAQDMFGDTTGLTGITTSSPKEGGADPEEKVPDSSNLPGTLINEPKDHPQYGLPHESVDERVYKKNLREGMSQEEAKRSEDAATENKTDYEGTLDVDDITKEDQNAQTSQVTSPSVQGETSISGDMPNVDADVDMEQVAKDVGTQMDEDPEHPEEVDIGRDIDKAEEEILQS